MAGLTRKGSAWEWAHSLWMLWTLVPVLNFVAFLYIGMRVKQRKWIVTGIVYLIPVVLLFVDTSLFARGSTFDTSTMLLFVAGMIAGIVTALVVRKEYVLRLVAREDVSFRETEALKNEIELEYDVDLDRSIQQKKEEEAPKPNERRGFQVIHNDEASAAAVPEYPIDLNAAPAEEIAQLPGVGTVLAKKAVSIREAGGPFGSIEEFVGAIGLRPQMAEQIRPHAYCG